MNPPNDTKLPDSFWAKVQPEGDCLVWTGHTIAKGYGRVTINCVRTLVHRLAMQDYLQDYLGEIPSVSLVLHRCDNPPCVKREHLYFGTHQDNADDKVRRGRSITGTSVSTVKLTETSVRAIRRYYATGVTTHRKLASIFEVAPSTIADIVKGRSWKHVV